jgi:hypothetical protein
MRKGGFFVAAIVVGALLVPQAVLAAAGSFSSSNATPAVIGTNTMTGTNQAPGGRFSCQANGCRAVYATSNGTSAGSYGVYASAKDPTGRALAGFNTATTGTAIGLSGQSSSTTGRGLNGLGLSQTGANVGGFLETKSRSDGAAGVFGWASNTSSVAQGAGENYGVYGRVDGQGDNASGVLGRATATANDPSTNGVWGDAPSANGTGVFGSSTGGIGVVGIGGVTGLLGMGAALGVLGDSAGIGDGSYGVLSLSDAGVGGHLVGKTGQLVGSCAWAANSATTAGCTFTVPFPGGGTPPVVLVIPMSDPSDRWWMQSINQDVNGDWSGFTVRRGGTGPATTITWLAIGIDETIGTLAAPRLERARRDAFDR